MGGGTIDIVVAKTDDATWEIRGGDGMRGMVEMKKGVEELFSSLKEVNEGGIDVRMVWREWVTVSCLDSQSC